MRAVSTANNKLENASSSFADKWAKKLVLKWLKHFSQGSLTIDDGGRRYHFGEDPQAAKISAYIKVNHDSVYRDVLFNGTVGSGEAYMKGAWESPNLTNVIRLMCLNMDMLQKINKGWSKINSVMASWIHRLRANTKKNARLNIAAHYDLGNDFFSLFLDPTMMYSSAIYANENVSLDEAAVFKLDHICRRLQLNKNDHLLEIGTGWGGMAIHAAKHYGCRVTTTTISKEQHQHAVEAVKQAGLEGRITVLLDDYRDLEGGFDKLVSIEMIEAVGRRYYPSYFSTCARLLKDDGLMLIQAITMPDQRYSISSDSSDFIQRYIFPGGDLPSLGAIARNVGEYTDMQIAGIEDITLDYARTLEDWRQRFFDKLAFVKSLGYDDVFIRMWDFYLSYCEGGFRERSINTLQLLITKLACPQLPPIRPIS
ncbi:MAG: cyclopropane-fatty-acyl-phospholipid synthase family protein [Pseudomonadota bacterium]